MKQLRALFKTLPTQILTINNLSNAIAVLFKLRSYFLGIRSFLITGIRLFLHKSFIKLKFRLLSFFRLSKYVVIIQRWLLCDFQKGESFLKRIFFPLEKQLVFRPFHLQYRESLMELFVFVFLSMILFPSADHGARSFSS